MATISEAQRLVKEAIYQADKEIDLYKEFTKYQWPDLTKYDLVNGGKLPAGEVCPVCSTYNKTGLLNCITCGNKIVNR